MTNGSKIKGVSRIEIKLLDKLFNRYTKEIEADTDLRPMGVEEALEATVPFVGLHLRSTNLYIDGDCLVFRIAEIEEWRFISKVVWEAYDGILSDSDLWNYMGLGGDDDVDYNSTYLDSVIEPLNWLLKNNKI